METLSVLLAICVGNSPVTGEFPTQRTVMRSFDAFIDQHLNKWLTKQLWSWWFETLSRPLSLLTLQCHILMKSNLMDDAGFHTFILLLSSLYQNVCFATFHLNIYIYIYTGLNLGLCPANERRCYKVTLSLIGWMQTSRFASSQWEKALYIYIYQWDKDASEQNKSFHIFLYVGKSAMVKFRIIVLLTGDFSQKVNWKCPKVFIHQKLLEPYY